MDHSQAAKSLAAILRDRRSAIESAWTDTLLAQVESLYRDRPREEISSWAAGALDRIIEYLRTDSTEPLESHIEQLTIARHRDGFGITEVIQGLLLLKEAVRPFLPAAGAGRPPGAGDLIARLDVCLRFMVARFAGRYSAAMQRNLEEEKKRTALMLRAVEAAGGSLDLDTVLERVAICLVTALTADSCCIHLPERESSAYHLRACAGRVPGGADHPLVAAPLSPESDPLLVRALERHGPVRYDASDAEPVVGRWSCRSLSLAWLIGIPIILANRVQALAIAVSADPRKSADASQVELAVGIANAVAPAIENAKLYEHARKSLAEIRTVQNVTTALVEEEGLDHVFDIVCRKSLELTGARGGGVFLLEDDGSIRIVKTAGTGTDRIDRILRDLAVGERHGIPHAVLIRNRPAAHGSGGPPAPRVDSLLAVPFRIHTRLIGTILLLNKTGGFLQEDSRVIGLIADQLAINIEHAQLHEHHERMAVLEERQRLARELHDSVTQSIYGITMYSEAAARRLEKGELDGSVEKLRSVRDMALDALREMRLLIFELRPPDLEKDGLVSALQTRLAAVEGHAGLTTSFECEGIDRLPQPVEKGLHRIAQEALNNVLKHARASRVDVRLLRSAAGIRLEILDNGIGLDREEARRKGGFGLNGMEERAAEMGARFSIAAGPNGGTHVRLDLPGKKGNP